MSRTLPRAVSVRFRKSVSRSAFNSKWPSRGCETYVQLLPPQGVDYPGPQWKYVRETSRPVDASGRASQAEIRLCDSGRALSTTHECAFGRDLARLNSDLAAVSRSKSALHATSPIS